MLALDVREYSKTHEQDAGATLPGQSVLQTETVVVIHEVTALSTSVLP